MPQLFILGFVVENTRLPSDIQGSLCREGVFLHELGSLFAYLQHICECSERKMKQFAEAEQDPGNAYGDGRINVSFKNLIYNL